MKYYLYDLNKNALGYIYYSGDIYEKYTTIIQAPNKNFAQSFNDKFEAENMIKTSRNLDRSCEWKAVSEDELVVMEIIG